MTESPFQVTQISADTPVAVVNNGKPLAGASTGDTACDAATNHNDANPDHPGLAQVPKPAATKSTEIH